MQGDSTGWGAHWWVEMTPFHVDEDRLTRGHIGDQGEVQGVEGDALGGDHVLDPVLARALAVDQGADAVGVAEAEDAEARDHGHGGIAPAAASMDPGHGAEQVAVVDAQFPLDLQLMGEDVEQDLRVRLGVDVAQVLHEEVALQVLGVGEIAVVGQDDSVGGIDVEGLGLGGTGRAAGGGIAHMAYAHVALELDHVAGAKDIAHQTGILAQVELVALGRDDPRGILTAMLKHQQGVIEGLVDGALAHDANDAAHGSPQICAGALRGRMGGAP